MPPDRAPRTSPRRRGGRQAASCGQADERDAAAHRARHHGAGALGDADDGPRDASCGQADERDAAEHGARVTTSTHRSRSGKHTTGHGLRPADRPTSATRSRSALVTMSLYAKRSGKRAVSPRDAFGVPADERDADALRARHHGAEKRPRAGQQPGGVGAGVVAADLARASRAQTWTARRA